MKWLLTLDDYDREVTRVVKGTKAQATAAAKDLFNNHLSDSSREYDEPDDVPVVMVYEITSSFGVSMAEDYFKQREEDEKDAEEYKEQREREQFEKLKKKFGDK